MSFGSKEAILEIEGVVDVEVVVSGGDSSSSLSSFTSSKYMVGLSVCAFLLKKRKAVKYNVSSSTNKRSERVD